MSETETRVWHHFVDEVETPCVCGCNDFVVATPLPMTHESEWRCMKCGTVYARIVDIGAVQT